MAQKGTSVVGQACTVTSGPNEGQKGTYTRDEEGNIWCEGDWGGTQCRGNKCSDAKAQINVFEYVDAGGTLVHEVQGLFNVEGRGIFQCTTILNAATGESRNVTAIPIAAASLKALRESGTEVERRAAEVIESHLKGQGGAYGQVA